MGIRETRDGGIQQREDGEQGFSEEKQQAFLTHFAASCNVAQSARKAGVRKSTLYARRMSDPAFRDAWAAAQDCGTTALRCELVARGLRLLRAATPGDEPEDGEGEEGGAALAGMDARFLLNLVESHERNAGKAPGEIQPQYSDAEEAAGRLQLLLLRMRAERRQEQQRRRAERSR